VWRKVCDLNVIGEKNTANPHFLAPIAFPLLCGISSSTAPRNKLAVLPSQSTIHHLSKAPRVEERDVIYLRGICGSICTEPVESKISKIMDENRAIEA
jgi:hypothetical protein